MSRPCLYDLMMTLDDLRLLVSLVESNQKWAKVGVVRAKKFGLAPLARTLEPPPPPFPNPEYRPDTTVRLPLSGSEVPPKLTSRLSLTRSR